MKKILAMLLIIILFTQLAGCWNRIEPENVLIILAVAFDIDENSGEIRAIVQAANPGAMEESPEGNDGGGGSAVWVTESTGRTAFEAVRKVNIKSTRQADFTHTMVVIFSEKLARQGIGDILDYLDRERQLRPIARPLVLIGDPRKALEAEFPLEETGASGIFNHLTITRVELCTTIDLKMRHIYNRLAQPGWELVLPRLELVEVEDGELSRENPLVVKGTAAFKKDRLAGWLGEQESRGLNWLHDNIQRVTYVLKSPPEDEKEVTVEVFESVITTEAVVNGEDVLLEVHVRADGRVQETTTSEEYLTADTELTDSLDRRLAEAIRNDIKSVITTAQHELEADVLGFGNHIYRTNLREWEKLEPRWDEIFPRVEVKITVDANVRRTGLIKDPLHIR